LITILLLAASGIVGPRAANATLLCSSTLCKPSEVYPANTSLSASLSKGTEFKVLTSVGTVACESASIVGKTTAESGKPLPLEVTTISFSGNCHLGGTSCTLTTTALPSSPSLKAIGEGNGTLSLEGSKVQFKCGFLINCNYSVPTLLQVKGGSPAIISAEKAVLTSGKETFCPETAELDATTYSLTAPIPAYVVE
jgi:hypothetical protein